MVRSPELPPSLATPENPNPPVKKWESWPRRDTLLGKSGVPPRPAPSQKTLTFLRRSSAPMDSGRHPQPSETASQGDLCGAKGIASGLLITVHGSWQGAVTERGLAQRLNFFGVKLNVNPLAE